MSKTMVGDTFAMKLKYILICLMTQICNITVVCTSKLTPSLVIVAQGSSPLYAFTQRYCTSTLVERVHV